MPDIPRDIDSQGADLLEQAQQSENEQTTLLDTTSLASRYNDALADYIQEKQEQVERLEDRLENLIEQEMINLKEFQAHKPTAIFLRPGTRVSREKEQAKRQEIIQRLQSRLEQVREIREEMGLYGPRIEELAIRKLRLKQPHLAAEWDAKRTAERLDEARQREQFESRSISLSRVRSIDLPE